MSKNNIWILCPFYNEQSHIANMYSSLAKSKLPYLFVDDGSTDRTVSILKNIWDKIGGFDIYSYDPNKGKGNAIKIGADYLIRRKNTEYILTFDSDGQNRVEDIPNFLTALKSHPDAKIIIGNRLHSPKDMPFIRLITNRFMSWLISLIAHQKIADTQCGMRLVHKDVFDLETRENRFAYESEQLIKAGRAGYKIVSVPIKCIYDKNRISKMNYLSDTIRFFKMIIKLIR